jgi:hypothetical protein
MRLLKLGVVLVLLLGAFGAVATSGLAQTSPLGTVVSVHTLPLTRLGTAVNAGRPATVTNDRAINLGGIGSDLWHDPKDPNDTFWMLTDRGPNGQIVVGTATRRTFPVPDFTPLILQVQLVNDGTIKVLKTLPLLGQSGKPITGLSNLAGGIDEEPYDYAAQGLLTYNQSGLDTEGLVRTPNGDFWLVDEYSTSLVRVDTTGKVLKRYVPEGVALPTADYPVAGALPAIFAKRTANRGFEGIAITPDGKTLLLALQSPLRHPDAAVGNASRNTRFLTFDIATEKVTGEYVYQFQNYQEFKAPRASEMKVSSVVALDATTFLVDERTDAVAKVYRIDLSKATNILGSKWDAAATSPALEALSDVVPQGITPLPKWLVVDLSQFSQMPGKVEGISVIGSNTLVVANDNDFSFSEKADAAGNFADPGVRSQVLVLNLPGGFTGVAAPFLATVQAAAAPAPAKTGTAGPLPATSAGAMAVGIALAALAGVLIARRTTRGR